MPSWTLLLFFSTWGADELQAVCALRPLPLGSDVSAEGPQEPSALLLRAASGNLCEGCAAPCEHCWCCCGGPAKSEHPLDCCEAFSGLLGP